VRQSLKERQARQAARHIVGMSAALKKIAIFVFAVVLPYILLSIYLFAWPWPAKEYRATTDFVAFIVSAAAGAVCFGWLVRASRNWFAWTLTYAIALAVSLLTYAIFVISRIHGRWYEAQYPSWP
jgi:hypothetical protein